MEGIMSPFRKKPKDVPSTVSEPKEKKLRKFKSLAAISSVFRRGQKEASSAHDTNPMPVVGQQVAVVTSEQPAVSESSISSQRHVEDFQSQHEALEQQHMASQQPSDRVSQYQVEAIRQLASQQEEIPQYQDEAAQHLASPHHQDEIPQGQDEAVQHDKEGSEFHGEASKTGLEAPEHHEEASKRGEETFELNEADLEPEQESILEVLQAQTKPRKVAKREPIQPTYYEVPLPVRPLTTEKEIIGEELSHIKEKEAKKPYLRNDTSSQERLLEDSIEEELEPIEEQKAKKYKKLYVSEDDASSQEELLGESSDSPRRSKNKMRQTRSLANLPAQEIDPEASLPLPLLAGSLSMRSVENSEKVTQAMPATYWMARFTLLDRQFQEAEDRAAQDLGGGEVDNSKRLKNFLIDEETVERIFLHLDEFCITAEAKQSLKTFSERYKVTIDLEKKKENKALPERKATPDLHKERKKLRRRGMVFSSDEAPIITLPTGLNSHPPGSFATRPQSTTSHYSLDQVPDSSAASPAVENYLAQGLGSSAASPTVVTYLAQGNDFTPAGPVGPAEAGEGDKNGENNKDDGDEDKPKKKVPGRLRRYLSRKSMFFRDSDPEPPVPHLPSQAQ